MAATRQGPSLTTVKDAADRSYRVVCLTDACQAETAERHAQALGCFQGYAEQIPVACFVEALHGGP
jgi:nicotinamidase-related amidase